MSLKKLEWEDVYSVGVKEIDEQHKLMFDTINELFEAINEKRHEEILGNIIKKLVEYKVLHFETEEKYFKKFNYVNESEHVAHHRFFNDELNRITSKYSKYNFEFAFELVEFLENWLIEHLMNEDQKYKQCFKEHGLV
jgi:hemerythrin